MPTILRSKRYDLVEQELYALLISYNLIRTVIIEATSKEGGSPLSVSFLDTMQILIELAPQLSTFEAKKSKEALAYLYKLIAESKIDRPRRPRCNPRVVKIKMSNFKRKRKSDKSQYRNFEECIQIICQEETA